MRVTVKRSDHLEGSVKAPPSKSYTHRAVICCALAHGVSEIVNPLISEDTQATVEGCRALGIPITIAPNRLTVEGGGGLKAPPHPIECRDSASTLRFLTPVTAHAHGSTTLDGSEGLRKRPVGPLVEALSQLGVQAISREGYPPVTVRGGGMRGGEATIRGDVSSQFLTGLLLATPLGRGETKISLSTAAESRPYIDLTLKILKVHGVEVGEASHEKFEVPGGQTYKPHNHRVPGDYSSAAFLLAAAAITNSKLRIENLNEEISVPDRAILALLGRMGARLRVGEGAVEVEGGRLVGIRVDAGDIPDLVPVLAVLGCFAQGETVIYNAQRLRIKESDRLASLASELGKMGGRIKETRDGLAISGSTPLYGATIDPHNDHRIAMACAVAGLGAEGETRVLNPETVNKSYPNFFRDLSLVGGRVDVE